MRNKCCFQGKRPDPVHVLRDSQALFQEMLKGLEQERTRRVPGNQARGQGIARSANHRKHVRWKKPPLGFIKCNVDAAFQNPSIRGASGIVIRDDRGYLLSGLANKFFVTTPRIAEAIAFRDAISFLASTGSPKVIVETDCLDLLRACTGEATFGEIKGIVRDVLELRSNFEICSFTWSPRNGNKATHAIASSCMRDRLPGDWVSYPPTTDCFYPGNRQIGNLVLLVPGSGTVWVVV